MNSGTTLLTNLPGRRRNQQVRSLDGSWRAIVDPYQSGLIGITGERNTRGYFRDFSPRHPADRIEYDFDTSLELTVPGDWNTQHPELHYYEGTVWYRRLFDGRGEEEGTRTFLSFGAANHTCRVFLDGEELAVHEGGFGPFAVDVTGRVGAREHSLVVMVDNRREAHRIPAMRTDWWNFGGLTRSVELVTVPQAFIRDAWITMAADGSIIGEITATGEPTTAVVELGAHRIEVPVGGDEPASFTFDGAGIERWQPGHPVLHDVTFATDTDRIGDRVGFRTVEVRGTEILVNGEPTFLRGISLHAEGPSGGRRAHGAVDADTLVGWAAELGANFVRLAHYQHDEAMVRAADERGLLAWCELPVYWGIDFDNEATMASALDQTDELVIRDRSRASVILWSAANETMPGESRERFIGALLQRMRRLDPTRLVTAALLTLPSNDPRVHIDDPLGHSVDVIGVNQYLGWYYGDRSAIPATEWTSDFGKPIVFSELGAGAKAGNHGTAEEIWTEEFQAAVYEAQIEMIRRQRECAGMSPWILKDFRTPMRVLPGIQDGYNRKGLVDEEGRRKLAFDTLRAFYQTLP